MPVRYRSFRLTLLRARMLTSKAFLLVVLSTIPHLLAQETEDKLPPLTSSYWSVWHPGEFTPQRGIILEMDASETRLRTPQGRERILRGAYHWQREGIVPHSHPTCAHIITTAGDRITGTIRGLDTGRILFQPTTLGAQAPQWRVPFSALRAAWVIDLPADIPTDPSFYSWLEPRKNQDVLRLRNGDVMSGILLEDSGAPEHLVWQLQTPSGQTLRIAPEQIAAVCFNPTLARRRFPKEPQLLLVLDDGSRLHLTRFRLANHQLHGTTLWGITVTIPWQKVVLASATSPQSPRLTDLAPSQIEHQPYLEGSLSPRFEQFPGGLMLQLIGQTTPVTVDWGFAIAPRTTIHYELNQRYHRLETWVSLVPTAVPDSRVQLRILCDGKPMPLPQDGILSYGPAQLLQVPLDKVRHLTLMVDFPSRGEAGALTIWGWPRLVP